MDELKQFNKYLTPEDALGSCCLDGRCEKKTLNMKDKSDSV